MKIGMLKEVDIRDLWKHEQYDFSNGWQNLIILLT